MYSRSKLWILISIAACCEYFYAVSAANTNIPFDECAVNEYFNFYAACAVNAYFTYIVCCLGSEYLNLCAVCAVNTYIGYGQCFEYCCSANLVLYSGPLVFCVKMSIL
jgi:hypothetical protein